MAVWTFTLSAVYASSSGSLVRSVFKQSGTVTRLDGSAVPPITQGGSVVPRVTTDGNGSVQFTIDRAAWGTSAPEVLVDFGPRAVRVKADEYGDYLASIATGSSAASIDAHLGGDATNLVPTVNGKVDTADLPALVTPTMRTRARVGGRIVAWCGDSITDGAGSSNAATKSYRAQAAVIIGGHKVSKQSIDGGVPGDRSDQLLARMDGIISSGAEALFVMIGTNDAGQNVPLSTYQANVQAIKAKADAASLPIVFGLIPPRGSGGATANTLARTYNLWLSLWCVGVGIPLADTYTPLADPATGYLTAADDSGDGTHPSDAGHLALAQAIAPILGGVLDASAWPVLGPAGSGLLTDPLMTSTSGGWGLKAGASSTRTIVAPAAGELPAGSWQRLTVNNSGGGSSVYSTTGVSLPTSGWAAGERLLVCLYVRGSTSAALNKVAVLNQSLVSVLNMIDVAPVAAPGPVMAYYDVPTTGTPTALTLAVIIRAAAGETSYVDVGAADVFNLTRLGLADYA